MVLNILSLSKLTTSLKKNIINCHHIHCAAKLTNRTVMNLKQLPIDIILRPYYARVITRRAVQTFRTI